MFRTLCLVTASVILSATLMVLFQVRRETLSKRHWSMLWILLCTNIVFLVSVIDPGGYAMFWSLEVYTFWFDLTSVGILNVYFLFCTHLLTMFLKVKQHHYWSHIWSHVFHLRHELAVCSFVTVWIIGASFGRSYIWSGLRYITMMIITIVLMILGGSCTLLIYKEVQQSRTNTSSLQSIDNDDPLSERNMKRFLVRIGTGFVLSIGVVAYNAFLAARTFYTRPNYYSNLNKEVPTTWTEILVNCFGIFLQSSSMPLMLFCILPRTRKKEAVLPHPVMNIRNPQLMLSRNYSTRVLFEQRTPSPNQNQLPFVHKESNEEQTMMSIDEVHEEDANLSNSLA